MLVVGQVFLNRYQVIEESRDAPAYARTLKAFDQTLSRLVQLTVLDDLFAQNDVFANAFVANARQAVGLDHPNIARIYDVGFNPETRTSFVVTEFVDGISITDFCQRQGHDLGATLSLFAQVLDGLQFAHSRGLLHLGISPSTVRVTPDGHVKILGFGITCLATQTAPSGDAVAVSLGSSGYLAPEQILRQPATHLVDVYAAGLLLSQGLCGRPTWDGSLRGEQLTLRAQSRPTLPGTVAPYVPAAIDGLIGSAISNDPGSRPHSAAQMSEKLSFFNPHNVPATQLVYLPPTELVDTFNPGYGVPTNPPRADVAPSLAAVFPSNSLSPRAFDVHEFTAGRTRKAMVGSIIGALAVIVVLSAAILAVVSTLPANFLPSTSRVVPSVIGKTFDQAKAAVTGVGLKVVRAQKVDPTGTLDTVVSANPPVGAQLEVGATVTLTVIVGALQVNVPDLTGMSIDAATEALSKLGLTLGETSEVASAAVGKGLILSSTPAVGTPVSQGTPIAISLASGDIEIPNLVGKSLSEASFALTGASIGVSPIVTSDPSCPATNPVTVATQSPSAGTVPQGTQVSLTYCSGS